MLDIECPPSGRILEVTYPNNDKLRIEFVNLETPETSAKRYPDFVDILADVQYPLVSIEFVMKVAALDIDINSASMQLPNYIVFRKNRFEGLPIALALGEIINGASSAVHIA